MNAVSPYWLSDSFRFKEMTRRDPSRSFLFNAHSDPPTTTMQRIKGITTGSLPTFVDMSANFGATSIDEDSVIKQMNLAGKRVRDHILRLISPY